MNFRYSTYGSSTPGLQAPLVLDRHDRRRHAFIRGDEAETSLNSTPGAAEGLGGGRSRHGRLRRRRLGPGNAAALLAKNNHLEAT